MAHDYEDVFDTEDMDDDELRALVEGALRGNNSIDVDDITVEVRNGEVTLTGRVGTEVEARVAEHIVTDQIGLDVNNELTVDEIRRSVSPEAIDEHLADEDEHAGLLLGDEPPRTSDTAAHIGLDRDSSLLGTTDQHESIEEAMPWIPPESPTPEGLGGQTGPTSTDAPSSGRH